VEFYEDKGSVEVGGIYRDYVVYFDRLVYRFELVGLNVSIDKKIHSLNDSEVLAVYTKLRTVINKRFGFVGLSLIVKGVE